jgi:prepilin-type N-terminal cleavage/methylation domain-containing protein
MKGQQGVQLIEIMIVIAILGIIAVIVIGAVLRGPTDQEAPQPENYQATTKKVKIDGRYYIVAEGSHGVGICPVPKD